MSGLGSSADLIMRFPGSFDGLVAMIDSHDGSLNANRLRPRLFIVNKGRNLLWMAKAQPLMSTSYGRR